MKHKLLYLLCLLLLITGCYDYKELNSLAVITGMGLDIKDEHYYVTVQVLEPTKGENKTSVTPKVLEGSGITISEALNEINRKIPKELYLSNLDILIVSKDIIQQNKDYLNFFMTNTKYDMNPFILIADNANHIFTFHQEKEHYDATMLKDILNNAHLKTGESSFATMTDLFEQNYKKVSEIIIPEVSVNKDALYISNNYVLKENKIKTTFNEEEIFLYNLVMGNMKDAIWSENINNEMMSFHLTKQTSHIRTNLKGETPLVTFRIDLKATISESNDKSEHIKPLLQDKLTHKIERFVKRLQQEQIDIFHLGNHFHQYHSFYFNSLSNWYSTYETLEIKTDLNIQLETTWKEN